MKPSSIVLGLLYVYMIWVTHMFLYAAETQERSLNYWQHAAIISAWPVFYIPVALGKYI